MEPKNTVNKAAKEVPTVDVNAELNIPIDESTEYEMGVTPRNKFIYILGMTTFVCVSLISISVLVFYIKGFKGKSEDKNITVSTVDVKNNDTTETPVKSFDKQKVTFEVLNGSGVAGAAKTAANSVERLGYSLKGTGNGDPTTGNKLFLSKDIQEFSKEIIADLKDFSITQISGDIAGATAAARIVIGKQ